MAKTKASKIAAVRRREHNAPVPLASRFESGSVVSERYKTVDEVLNLELVVEEAGGTAPTLDVAVDSSVDGQSWTVVGAFTQATGPGDEIITTSQRVGDWTRFRWVLGGTDPSFRFAIRVVE